MRKAIVGCFHQVRLALGFQPYRYIAHSSGASKGPRVELRGREANMVSIVTRNQHGITDDSKLTSGRIALVQGR
jgi:hypothetical protein